MNWCEDMRLWKEREVRERGGKVGDWGKQGEWEMEMKWNLKSLYILLKSMSFSAPTALLRHLGDLRVCHIFINFV